MGLTQSIARRALTAIIAGALFAGGNVAVREVVASQAPVSPVSNLGDQSEIFEQMQESLPEREGGGLREYNRQIASMFGWKNAFSGNSGPAEDPTVYIPGYDDPMPEPPEVTWGPEPTGPVVVYDFTPFERTFPEEAESTPTPTDVAPDEPEAQPEPAPVLELTPVE